MTHIDELSYLRYLDGQLASTRAREVEEHTRACFECSKKFDALKHETALLRSSLVEADETLPKQFEASPSEELSWAWLSVLGLAGFGLYMLWEWLLIPWWQGLQSVGVGTADDPFDPAVPWASVGRMVDDGGKGGTRFDSNHPDGLAGNHGALGLSFA